MKIVAIGRSEWLYNSIAALLENGHSIAGIVTSEGADEYQIQESDFFAFAKLNNIPYMLSKNNSEITKFLNNLGQFDIGISVNHTTILNSEVLDLFSNGVLNFHGGDLPRYKGNAAQVWAILNGEKQIGFCVHRMVANEVDLGPIISRRYFPVELDTKIGEIYHWMGKTAPEMFLDSIKELEFNKYFELSDTPSDIRPHRCYSRRPEDARIKWDKESIEIVRMINASGPPFKGAYCYYGDLLLRVLDGHVYELSEDISAVPGQIIKIAPDQIIVACGNNDAICISKIASEEKPFEIALDKFFKSTRSRLT